MLVMNANRHVLGVILIFVELVHEYAVYVMESDVKIVPMMIAFVTLVVNEYVHVLIVRVA